MSRIPYDLLSCEQRSAEWVAARLGRLTSSRAADMLANGKGGAEAYGRRDLRVQLALERIVRTPCERSDYVSLDMKRGIELEPDAVAAYEIATDTMLVRSGFLSCRDVLMGASLDGHTADLQGIVELKIPKAATHLSYLERPGVVPVDYEPQIIHGLLVSGAAWADFVSYDPRFPPDLRLFIVRVWADRLEHAIRAYEGRALEFLDDVARTGAAIEALARGGAGVR